VNKLLAVAVILAFFLLLSGGNPADALDTEPGFFLAQTSQESSAESDADEDFEDDEEFDDEVVDIKLTIFSYRWNSGP
jgi:hypothetical protein